jgi:hypothetical protein
MKCANPECDRGVGLVHHRRRWFSKRRYGSKNYRDTFVADLAKQSEQEWRAMTDVEWLATDPESTGEVRCGS